MHTFCDILKFIKGFIMRKLFIFSLLVFFAVFNYAQTSAGVNTSNPVLDVIQLENYWAEDWIVIAQIQNNLSVTIGDVRVGLAARNSDGKLVYTDSTHVQFPVSPGGSQPFMFIVPKAQAVEISRFAIDIEDYKRGPYGSFNFEVIEMGFTEKNEETWKISGYVRNTGQEFQENVMIGFTGYNEGGELTYFDTVPANKSVLQAGEQSLFELYIPLPIATRKISRYGANAYSDMR